MRQQSLLKFGKNNYIVDFEMLDRLGITQKEFILLEQISYINNVMEYVDFPKNILAKMTNMSRGYLYSCIKKLTKKGLLLQSDTTLLISDAYKNIKVECYKKSHRKAKKSAQNVACESSDKALGIPIAKESGLCNLESYTLEKSRSKMQVDSINNRECRDEMDSLESVAFVSTINTHPLTPQSINIEREGGLGERISVREGESGRKFSTWDKSATKTLSAQGGGIMVDSHSARERGFVVKNLSVRNGESTIDSSSALNEGLIIDSNSVTNKPCFTRDMESTIKANLAQKEDSIIETRATQKIESSYTKNRDSTIKANLAQERNFVAKTHSKQKIESQAKTALHNQSEYVDSHHKIATNDSLHNQTKDTNNYASNNQAKNTNKHNQTTKNTHQKEPLFLNQKVSKNMTEVSENLTKVSEKMTSRTIYNTNIQNIQDSLNDKSFKEHIYVSHEANAKERQRDLSLLLKQFLESPRLNRESYVLAKNHREELHKLMQDEISNLNKVQISDKVKAQLDDEAKLKLIDFMNELDGVGMFYSIQARVALNHSLEWLLEHKMSIKEAIVYSKKHSKLWICNETYPNDEAGYRLLMQNYQDFTQRLMLKRQRDIANIQAKYNSKIQEFLEFRSLKNRFFNQKALESLCLELARFDESGKDVAKIIDQSIERDYNWVFPLTHRRKNKRYSSKGVKNGL